MNEEKKTWFRLELLYDYEGQAKKFEYVNCDAELVRKIRFTLLDEGLQVPVTLAQSIIIFPWSIRHITVWRQDRFLKNLHSDMQKTVFDGDKKKV